MAFDVAIAGGGVIGLAVAYELAAAGARVVVFERGRIGQEASWAAAGMLAVAAEAEAPGPFAELCRASLARYPEFVAALREASGIDCELDPTGLIRLARSEAEAAALQAQIARSEAGAGPAGAAHAGTGQMAIVQAGAAQAEWLEPDELRRLEPLLAPAPFGGARFSGDQQVNNRHLVQALFAACVRRGVCVREHTEVLGVTRTPAGRLSGWRTPAGPVAAGRLVLALGAWSARASEWLGLTIPVRPVRGQILELRTPVHPRHIVFAAGTCYLVPKAQSRLLVGATSEEAGFARHTTLGALARLAEQAIGLAPALEQAEWTAAWAGLRPGTPDDRPILGPLPGHPELLLATGHYRNGILLAPITGRLLAALAADEPAPVDWRSFGVQRFAQAGAD